MSGDPEQEYFADGMVEEITTALARIRWLFVIARNSSFTYKGKAIDVKQVGRELGVRYVLEGSVRKAGDRVRITAQLIEAETDAHLWADRFDGSLEDVFELQDQVATSVAGVIEPTLQTAEIRRSSGRPTEDLTAYDLYLRALPAALSGEKKGFPGSSVQPLSVQTCVAYRCGRDNPNYQVHTQLCREYQRRRHRSEEPVEHARRLLGGCAHSKSSQAGPDKPLSRRLLCASGATGRGECDD